MKNLNYRKKDLIQRIKENRQKHIEEYNLAVQNMRDYAAEVYAKNAELARIGQDFETNIVIDVPVSHEEDYDEVIEMLEMAIEPEIELTHEQFTQYVMDNWNWSRMFNNTTQFYNG